MTAAPSPKMRELAAVGEGPVGGGGGVAEERGSDGLMLDEAPVATPGGVALVATPGGVALVATPGGVALVATPGRFALVATPDDADVATPGGVALVATPDDADVATPGGVALDADVGCALIDDTEGVVVTPGMLLVDMETPGIVGPLPFVQVARAVLPPGQVPPDAQMKSPDAVAWQAVHPAVVLQELHSLFAEHASQVPLKPPPAQTATVLL